VRADRLSGNRTAAGQWGVHRDRPGGHGSPGCVGAGDLL